MNISMILFRSWKVVLGSLEKTNDFFITFIIIKFATTISNLSSRKVQCFRSVSFNYCIFISLILFYIIVIVNIMVDSDLRNINSLIIFRTLLLVKRDIYIFGSY